VAYAEKGELIEHRANRESLRSNIQRRLATIWSLKTCPVFIEEITLSRDPIGGALAVCGCWSHLDGF